MAEVGEDAEEADEEVRQGEVRDEEVGRRSHGLPERDDEEEHHVPFSHQWNLVC